jgi:hypothetical protein
MEEEIWKEANTIYWEKCVNLSYSPFYDEIEVDWYIMCILMMIMMLIIKLTITIMITMISSMVFLLIS